MTTATAEKPTCKHVQLTDPHFTQTECNHLEMTSQVGNDPYCRNCGKKIDRVNDK